MVAARLRLYPACDYIKMRWIAMAVLCAFPGPAAELKPSTVEAFDRYIRQTEERLNTASTFLWADGAAERANRIRQGAILVEPFTGEGDRSVAGSGLIHDWVGSVFIPGATLERT